VSFALSILVVHPVVLVYAGQKIYSLGATSVMLYMAAMLVDAVAAIPLGLIWDRYREKTLAVIPSTGVAGAALLMLNPWLAALMTGIAVAGTETLLKAYVALKTAREERGTGYGAMALGLGAGMASSGLVYSLIVDFIARS